MHREECALPSKEEASQVAVLKSGAHREPQRETDLAPGSRLEKGPEPVRLVALEARL